MATIFETEIKSIRTLQTPKPNYVVDITWEVKGVDGDHTAQIHGHTRFTVDDAQEVFTPYDQLTVEKVTGWIPAHELEGAQACVQGQINSLKNPPVHPADTPLPWA